MSNVNVVLRPIGTPLPLGFLGLLVGTASFSALQLGWLSPAQGSSVALAVLVLTVPAQLLAAVFGFLARDPVAGTGFGILSGTWAAAALVTLTSPPGASTPGLGVIFLAAAVAMLVPVVAGHEKVMAAVVMAVTCVRFAFTGIAELSGRAAWESTAGWTGLVLAVLAFYAALGFELEGVKRSTALPLLRTGAAATALRGSAEQELGDVVQEAGVRKQL